MEQDKPNRTDSGRVSPPYGGGAGGEASEFYIQGNQHRRNGDYQAAMNAYMEAIALDPESPAVEALRMLQDIMNYYCKDVYNP